MPPGNEVLGLEDPVCRVEGVKKNTVVARSIHNCN